MRGQVVFFHILLVLITLMLLLFGLSLFTQMKKSFSGCNHASDSLLYTYFTWGSVSKLSMNCDFDGGMFQKADVNRANLREVAKHIDTQSHYTVPEKNFCQHWAALMWNIVYIWKLDTRLCFLFTKTNLKR